MTYKNNNFLHFILIIVILLVVLYLYKTNENELYTNSVRCLTESDYDNLKNKINKLELIYDHLNNTHNKNDKEYNYQLQPFIDNLLELFEKLSTIQISCVLNDKNQLELLNKMINLIDKNKEKLRTIKIVLMNKFNNNIQTADILPSDKILKLNTLNSLSNLFNNVSYIFNDNQDYTIDEHENILDKNGNNIGKRLNITDKDGNLINKINLYKELSPKQEKGCDFMCKHNKSYKEPKLHEEPQFKHIKYNVNL